ncbi:MAG: hypothetical protein JWQ13_1984 [Ramlibacter sp.]|jgi:hypothetical protein|nr:hypothetical protein [Ramlibacter sp.]
MSAITKLVGLVAGVSAVAAIGVAVAQGVPPNPYIANPALGAGQQSTHMTSMGETGVPGLTDPVRTATIVRQQQVAVAPAAPVAAQPAPAPVISAQAESTPPAQTMGAAPQAEAPAPVRIARHDRN